MDPETLRAECPAYESCCYLNTGASGPSPERVVEAVAGFERHHQYRAPCEEGPYTAAFDALADTREAVASLLGADAGQIALTRSTVEGITHVAGAIDWEPGDVVVRTDLEHPAGELPWQYLRDRQGIELRTIPTEQGRIDMAALPALLEEARLVCLSSLAWNYGTRLRVGEVVERAHEAGALVLVDAVQSVGQMPVDVTAWGADFVAASGHKWLLGPWGGGFLYVADPEAYEPQRVGYFSVEMGESDDTAGRDWSFRPSARRFELGTTAVAAYVGLEAAIETMQAVGIERVERRIEQLTDRLADGLGDRLVSPPDARSGLVVFDAEDPEGLVERLAGENIQIRSLSDPHACRASVHAVNTAEDVDTLLDALS
jgi:cysteine desulfurase/selenocysteine lyase